MLNIELFGHFSLCYPQGPVKGVSQPRLQALLAYLLLHRDAPQARLATAFQFWPDTSDKQALTNLRNLLHLLLDSLPEACTYVSIDRQTIQWNQESPFVLDVAEFEGALTRAHELAGAGEQESAIRLLEQAVHLYKEELLPGCYAEWLLAERERFRQMFLAANENLVELLEGRGEYPKAITYAQNLLRCDPLHEAACRQLMRLYALSGDTASAVRLYHTCAGLLQRELSIEPSPATQRMYQELLSKNRDLRPPAPVPESAASPPPLTGRQPEWSQLQAAWQTAAAGRPAFLLLSGEAGMGKTHLVQAFAHWAGQKGFHTAGAQCFAVEREVPFAPLAGWLRASAPPAGDGDWLDEIARLAPAAPGRAEPAAGGWPRLRLFEAMARLVRRPPAPVLLWIEDLQWCDRQTLEWLHYLLRFNPPAPMLVLGTLRPEEAAPNPALGDFLSTLRHSHSLHEIELGPLDARQAAQMAGGLAGKKLSPEQAGRVFQETEGIPYLIGEAVRAGGLAPGPGDPPPAPAVPGADAPGAGPPALLPGLLRLVESRLALLSSSAQTVLNLAALLGTTFSYAALRSACRMDEARLADALDELLGRRVLCEQGPDAYTFRWEKIRPAVLAAQSSARRRLLRGQIASAPR